VSSLVAIVPFIFRLPPMVCFDDQNVRTNHGDLPRLNHRISSPFILFLSTLSRVVRSDLISFSSLRSPLEAQGPWPSARSHACVSVVGGRVLVVGGQLPRDYRAVQAGRPNADLVDGHNQPAVVRSCSCEKEKYQRDHSVLMAIYR